MLVAQLIEIHELLALEPLVLGQLLLLVLVVVLKLVLELLRQLVQPLLVVLLQSLLDVVGKQLSQQSKLHEHFVLMISQKSIDCILLRC